MINLPVEAIPFLRQQRTEYANDSSHKAETGFAADVAHFAERLRPHLPPQKPQMRFIDIGCGIGFGLLGLLRIYGPEHRFVGIDRDIQSAKSEGGKVLYGFSEAPSAYNSLQLTRDILIAAGVPADHVECVDIDSEPFPEGSADVVTSTYAWGFHFPVQTYLREVEALLLPDGVVIIDLRVGVGQEELVSRRFEVVHAWPAPHGKSNRLVLRRKPA